jgi:ribose transport system permease protein
LLPSTSHTLRRWAADYLGMLCVLAVLVAIFGALSGHFLRISTFVEMANETSHLSVIAVGMTFVLVVGGIDLSVGSVLALSAAVLGVLVADYHWPVWLAVGTGMGVGLACGALNGLVTVAWAIPSFIVTLGMLEIARGLAYLVTDSQTKYIGDAIKPIGASLPGVGLSPAFFLSLAVVLLGQVVLSQTVFGRYAIAVGSNEPAARMSGIDPRRVRLGVFALSGLLTGLGAWFHTSWLQSANPNGGVGLELLAIAAVVIGGTSLMGGRGSVVNSFFGVLIITTLQTGLAYLGASDPTKRVVTGTVIVAAGIVDAYRHRAGGGPRAVLKRLFSRGTDR